jgi:hypothetical protein
MRTTPVAKPETGVVAYTVSATIIWVAVDAGNANPDFDFRYDAALAGYIFNLKTTGLGTGTYQLCFTVGGCAVLSAAFEVR